MKTAMAPVAFTRTLLEDWMICAEAQAASSASAAIDRVVAMLATTKSFSR